MAAFDQIEGDFALALWDDCSRELILARDALGRRPLYHARRGDRLLFGSHAPTIARQLGIQAPDLTEIASFLMQRGQGGTRSFYADIHRVPPGSAVRFSADGKAQCSRWWNPDTKPIAIGEDELLARVKDAFERSVRTIFARHDRLVAHLSAGLDSSLAVATASRLLGPGERLAAQCISPAHEVISEQTEISDEYPLARETAAMLGNVDLERVRADDHDWLALGDRYARAAGMPYRNIQSLGWFSASYGAAARGGASGLIESTDGNSTLSWLGHGAVPAMLRGLQIGRLMRFIADIRRHGQGSGLLVIPWAVHAMMPWFVAEPLAALRGFPRAETEAFLRRDHCAIATVEREIRSAGHWARNVRPIRDAKDRFTTFFWSDRASHFAAVERMFGIELCDPYASKQLVELTLRIDETRFHSDGRGRRFARQLLNGKVPKIVSDGQIDWLQATDWRVGAMAARTKMLADLDYADATPELAALFDIDAMRAEIGGWTITAETKDGISRGFRVVRAVGAIRFARWVAAGSPP